MLKDELIKSPIVEKIEDALDVNFNVSEIEVNTIEEFNSLLFTPFLNGDKVFYRGERINSYDRRLIPTLLRQEASQLKEFQVEKILNINAESLFDTYISKKPFYDIYKLFYDEAKEENMYNMVAFAQHYLDLSPFIDFTKSLYVAISFATKSKDEVNDDFVIYTVRDISQKNITKDIDQVNKWLNDYNVNVINLVPSSQLKKRIAQKKQEIKQTREELFESLRNGDMLEDVKSKDILEELKGKGIVKDFKRFENVVTSLSPSAKLIDIPTNDLMKYQQGVFLLLDGFNLIDSKYLTKNIRNEFEIKKYIINKSLAYELNKIVMDNSPQYRFECLLNISKAVKDFT